MIKFEHDLDTAVCFSASKKSKVWKLNTSGACSLLATFRIFFSKWSNLHADFLNLSNILVTIRFDGELWNFDKENVSKNSCYMKKKYLYMSKVGFWFSRLLSFLVPSLAPWILEPQPLNPSPSLSPVLGPLWFLV